MKKMIPFIIFIYSLLIQAKHCNAQAASDSLYVTNKDSSKYFYLHYAYQGAKKHVLLPYPFKDEAYLSNSILYIDNNVGDERSSVKFGDVLVVSGTNTGFGKMIFLLFIDMQTNSIINAYPEGVDKGITFLLTPLPYFVISNNMPMYALSLKEQATCTTIKRPTIMASSAMTFVDTAREEVSCNYYSISKKAIKQTYSKKIVLSREEAFSELSFKHGELLKQMFPELH